ncbi:MAG: GNAT family N-acetyltransferase [Thermoplasmatota archaeon]
MPRSNPAPSRVPSGGSETIGRGTEADRGGILRVVNAAFAVETFLEGVRLDEERWVEALSSGPFLVARAATESGPPGPIVGAVHLEVRGRRGYFGLLAVDPTHQGRGLGARIVAAAEGALAASGCEHVDISVLSLRPQLLPFYRHLGYREIGVDEFRPSRPLRPGVRCFKVIMTKRLGTGPAEASEPSGPGEPVAALEPEVNRVRQDYDRIAIDYARHIAEELAAKPFDRELLARFAARCREGEVCDVGCGPGHVARYLADRGAFALGLDLSWQMTEEARRRHPTLVFLYGDMRSMPFPSGWLAGVASFYAIVNLRPPVIAQAFQEMHRVLRPGGVSLVAFHAGAAALREREIWGHPLTMEFFLHPPRQIQDLLTGAGFDIEEVLTRPPYGAGVEYPSERCYILARKPTSEG